MCVYVCISVYICVCMCVKFLTYSAATKIVTLLLRNVNYPEIHTEDQDNYTILTGIHLESQVNR